MEPRRVHGGFMVFLILLIVGLPLASVGTAVQRIADGRWNDVERETWIRMCALQRASPRRPVLRGEPLPGNAWKDYEKAASLKYSDESVALENYAIGKTELSREEAQALLEPHLPLLKSIRAGTHRQDLLRTVPWNDSLPPHNGHRVTAFGICRARFLAEDGDVAGAVELLLDLMQYLGDLGRLGRGWSVLSTLERHEPILTELRSMMAAGLLDRDQLRQVAREMSMLEKSLPSFGAVVRDLAMFNALQVLRAKTVENFLGEHQMRELNMPTWSFEFSQKLLLSRYAELDYRLAERIAGGDGKPWSESRQVTADASSELTAAGHPFHTWKGKPGKIDYVPTHRVYLESLTHFRLTRAAAEYRAEGKVPELDDPFGDKLRWSKAGTVMRIWSLGWDGVDQGGVGGWSGKNNPDIVLEVRRWPVLRASWPA